MWSLLVMRHYIIVYIKASADFICTYFSLGILHIFSTYVSIYIFSHARFLQKCNCLLITQMLIKNCTDHYKLNR